MLNSWWPFPFPGDLPDPGIEPGSPPLQADSLPSEPPGKPRVFYDITFSFTYDITFLIQPVDLLGK